MAKPKSPFESWVAGGSKISFKHDMLEFMLYARKVAPKSWVSCAEIYQRVSGYTKTTPGDREIQLVKKAAGDVRRRLLEKHACSLVSDPAFGMRVTVDAEDAANTITAKTIRGWTGRTNMVVAHLAITNVKDIPNTPENKATREWLTDVNKMVKLFVTPDFLQRALPPKRDPEKK